MVDGTAKVKVDSSPTLDDVLMDSDDSDRSIDRDDWEATLQKSFKDNNPVPVDCTNSVEKMLTREPARALQAYEASKQY